MKKLLLFLLLIISAKVDAQNYQCLQTGVKRYFTNADGYLRGMRIDSVRTQGTNTVYYPFHTLRGIYDQNNAPFSVLLDSTGGSWLGKTVIEHSDGTFVFDNLWNDSTIIKSKANVGDSWIFYHDTANLYYLATVTEIDSMTVLGTIDSVKKILLHVYNGTSINYSHPLNNYEIFIAKNHGFVKIFDLYTFPYHQPDTIYTSGNWHGYGYDYYLDNVGVKQFLLVNFINPTERQLYDYSIGDVYEHKYLPQVCISIPNYYEPPQIIVDTITNKTTFSDSTLFNVHVAQFSPSCYECTSAPYYSYTSSNTSFIVKDKFLIDTAKIPEEANLNTYHFYYYYPFDTTYCYSSPAYYLRSNNIGNNHFTHQFEQPYDYSRYKIGLGRIAYENYFDPGDCLNSESDYLTFYHKITNNCGNYGVPPTSINNIENASNDIGIYPNPANETIHIQFNKQELCTVSIINIMGQVVLSRQYNSKEATITTLDMPTGVYDVRIQTDKGDVSHQKIVVQH